VACTSQTWCGRSFTSLRVWYNDDARTILLCHSAELRHVSKSRPNSTDQNVANVCKLLDGMLWSILHDIHVSTIQYISYVLNKNIGGMSPTKPRCLVTSAEGGRIKTPNAPSGVGYQVRCPLPSWLECLGERCKLSLGSEAEPWPETHFGIFWRPLNATLCAYMPMLRVRSSSSFSCHFWGKPMFGVGQLPPAPK